MEDKGSFRASRSIPSELEEGAEASVPANDEAGQFYELAEMWGRIALKVDHQSFAIGPDFEDTPEGKLEREWFKGMIHVAMRRVIEKALAARADAAPAPDNLAGYEAEGRMNQDRSLT